MPKIAAVSERIWSLATTFSNLFRRIMPMKNRRSPLDGFEDLSSVMRSIDGIQKPRYVSDIFTIPVNYFHYKKSLSYHYMIRNHSKKCLITKKPRLVAVRHPPLSNSLTIY
ncbi:unnamed protein product [Angiostrongylus costaricensis]|uniref:Ovule protein n=1 Tax=Angiostrongylus costaricensis TaxID=334426 RepID=A0A0R3PPY9_ANGCS|nr:unnamed protein product [Angiostrongylus costaricensis]